MKTYLVKCLNTGTYKIGHSQNYKSRFNQLKTANPFIELIGLSEISEKKLHILYDEYRFSGEWFNIPIEKQNELLGYFKPVKNIEFNVEKFIGCEKYKTINQKSKELNAKQLTISEIRKFTDLVYNDIGPKNFRELLKERGNFYLLITNEMCSNL